MLVSPGFQADARTLHKVIQQRWIQYQFAHRRPMSVGAMAQLLGNTLYYKRFFPYYTFNLCAGLDEEGALRQPFLPTASCMHSSHHGEI